MAHFAEINENNIVLRVIVVSNDLENIGEQWCAENLGGVWKQTSYNHKIRKQYAGIGYTYDAVKDIFIQPQPFLSWSLNDNSDWVAPVNYPSDGTFYYWDEDSLSWKTPAE
jgi:hypothetical protein